MRRSSAPHLHPGKAAATDAGWLGELHPTLLAGSWGAFELDVERLMEPLPERTLYEDVITYPAARQDIAVAVPEDVEAGAILAAVREAGGDELRDVRVFDVFRGAQVGEGRKSVAVNVVMRAGDRTLSAEDVLEVRTALIAVAEREFGAVLR